ncbi:hypothetical protein [Corallococcus terminator]|uniref:J domain-containing protein n=1 Tax=Corallococcus terminator TaxID=2316733 RepID=A0A3A8JJA9_9BACT|nr:hypothetical protein [Corallococcus terminator]RKG91940.1 hypothetical protein D7V88_08075 [Corallococcus terminator]
MDFEEALQELGVDADPGGDTVRRAYLRRLKTRKPETDPEGFARLRQAYETVLAAREGREGPRTEAESLAPAPEAGAPEATGPVSTLRQDVFDRFRAEFRALPPDAPPEAPVEVARRAVEALPDMAEARQWLVEALLAADRIPDALVVYRDAYRQGFTGFLVELAQRFPRALEDTELVLLAESGAPHGFFWGLTEQLLQQGDGARAAKCALAAFERMGTNPQEPPPPPGWFLQVQLLLYIQSQPESAREVGRRYAAWVRGEGLQDAFKSDETARIWPLLAQLHVLPDAFDPALRAGMAQALLDGDLDPAREAFQALRERSPQEASEAAGQVRAQAPDLEQLLVSPLLTVPEPVPSTSVLTVLQNAARSPQGRGVMSGAFILLFFLFKACFLPATREPRGTERPVVVEARRMATVLCSQLELQDKQRLCGSLQQLVVWGAGGRCSRVRREQAEVERQLEAQVAALGADAGPMQEVQQQRLKATREEFRRALLNVCQG